MVVASLCTDEAQLQSRNMRVPATSLRKIAVSHSHQYVLPATVMQIDGVLLGARDLAAERSSRLLHAGDKVQGCDQILRAACWKNDGADLGLPGTIKKKSSIAH